MKRIVLLVLFIIAGFLLVINHSSASTNTSSPHSELKQQEEAPLMIGDSVVLFESLVITLKSAQIVNEVAAYRDKTLQAGDGYRFVVLEVNYQTLNHIQSPYPAKYFIQIVHLDQDDDEYGSCIETSEPNLVYPPGYPATTATYACKYPVTVASSLEGLKVRIARNPMEMTMRTGQIFLLDQTNTNPVVINVSKETSKHFSPLKKLILRCGTKDHLEFSIGNPVWETVAGEAYDKLTVDLTITNLGKQNTFYNLVFEPLKRFQYYKVADKMFRSTLKRNDFPVPGATNVVSLSYAVPEMSTVPLLMNTPAMYEGCFFIEEDPIPNRDYVVFEIPTDGLESPQVQDGEENETTTTLD